MKVVFSLEAILATLCLIVFPNQVALASNSANALGTNWYIESWNSTYDGYQQAWRYLGHMVKCGYPTARYWEKDSHSHDSGDGEDGQSKYRGNNWCQRYLLWAAYIDPNYQGGGIGEYYYYNSSTGEWDDTSCDVHGNGRCAPMDCHNVNSTTWQLMGVYKEASYFGNDAFFEQLFKHEGVCVWNDDDLYEFMGEAREYAWPEGCVETNYGLYFDFKPTYNGNMMYGLYTDSICKTEYTGSSIDVETVAQSMGLLYGDYLDMWNEGLDPFKVCQPCRAYNLHVQSSQTGIYNSGWKEGGQYSGSGSYKYQNYGGDDDGYYGRNLDGDYDAYYDPNDGFFQCADDADYTNVNQCMKFRSHADLEAASWEDLVIATEQHGILPVKVGGTTFGVERMDSDQIEYLEAVQLAKLRKEEEEYKALVASVPSAAPIMSLGTSLQLGGAAFLGLVLLWALYRCTSDVVAVRRKERQMEYAEPLNPHEYREYDAQEMMQHEQQPHHEWVQDDLHEPSPFEQDTIQQDAATQGTLS